MPASMIKLVAFDMEGCLTADPTVWEIMHRKLGTWESHGLPYWRRYRAGGLDYDEFARMDVAVWRGAPTRLLEEAAREVPLMEGCAELLGALRAAGVSVAVISNGLLCVAERFRGPFGVEHVYANEALTAHGRLTGEIDLRVPYRAKGELLRGLSAELGVRRDQVAAVGDSPSDAAMFREAGLSIAFRPADSSLGALAAHLVADGPLTDLLPLLLP